MAETAGSRVFISHSHRDRDEALRLHRLLETNNAKTFIDQEEFRPGDLLPQSIREGIESCDKFLLIWSAHAARSKWVKQEWEAAYGLRKRIIPYVLDSTPLPDALQNFLYVDQEDREHGNAELLRAVLGKLPAEPRGVDIFPGHWEAEADMPDSLGNQVLYEFELRPNGQVTGQGRAKRTGRLGWVAGEVEREGGDIGLVFQPFPVRGNWSYMPGSGLRLDLVSSGFDQEFPQTIQIYVTGKTQNRIHGTGPEGSRWILRRKGA